MFSLFLVVLVLVFGRASGLTKEYVLVEMNKNWDEAQQHCIEHYIDLAKVNTAEENRRVLAVLGNIHRAWIGMRRADEDYPWLWSDGAAVSLYDWETCQYDNDYGDQDCAEIKPNGWNDQFCDEHRYFVCYRNLVLVQKKKTWEEALEYCRMNYVGLASPASYTNAQPELPSSQTNKVWTGLRFLNGIWFRVSREPWRQFPLLPSCPAPHYRCGSLDTQSHQWENRDCNEKLNFICYN